VYILGGKQGLHTDRCGGHTDPFLRLSGTSLEMSVCNVYFQFYLFPAFDLSWSQRSSLRLSWTSLHMACQKRPTTVSKETFLRLSWTSLHMAVS
jgi:hypothetical protein